MSFRAFIVGIPLVAVTVADTTVGVTAAVLYALAYSLELDRLADHLLRGGGEVVTRRLIAVALGLFLALPAVALAADETTTTTEKDFDPSEEWNLHTWIPIHLGPIDMSINKAVVYLLLGALLSCLLGIFVMRVKTGKEPDRKQALGEIIYEVARVQVAEQGLPTKAMRTWFPYCASLMIFIWVVNMLGFIPLPLSDEKVNIGGVELPTLAIFAATSTLSVTLALALMTWVFTLRRGRPGQRRSCGTCGAGSPTCRRRSTR